jgi:hypothetical protein
MSSIRCFYSSKPSLLNAALAFFMVFYGFAAMAQPASASGVAAPPVTSAAQAMWNKARTQLLRIRIVPIG